MNTLKNCNKFLYIQIKNFTKLNKKKLMSDNLYSKNLRRFSFESTNFKNNPHRVYIESHRGVNREEPENTLLAFERAIQIGCDSIELDIWLTRDKIPIVIHGDEHGNINEKIGKINSLDYYSICQVILEKNQKIPSLQEVFKLCKNKIFLNLEIKDPNPKEAFHEVYKLIVENNMFGEISISSFNHKYFDEIKLKELDGSLEFGFLFDTTENQKFEINYNNPRSTVNMWYKEITPEFVQKAHDNNIGVLAWFMFSDNETDDLIKYLIDCKVDVICSNDPKSVMRIRENVLNI